MNTKTNAAVIAFEQVKQAVTTLQADYKEVCQQIAKAKDELKALPNTPVPFEDMKAGILEVVDSAGARYADEYIKPALLRFATGHELSSSRISEKTLGKPIKFSELMGAIEQQTFPMAHAKLVQPSAYAPADDGAFHFFFADLIKAGLKKVLDTLEPSDFGYDKIHPSKVGTDRATRQAAIAAKEKELAELNGRRNDIADQLRLLGVQPGATA